MSKNLKCADCGNSTPEYLLDTVLLDEEGVEASQALYCQKCWPKHQRVPRDTWRQGDRP